MKSTHQQKTKINPTTKLTQRKTATIGKLNKCLIILTGSFNIKCSKIIISKLTYS